MEHGSNSLDFPVSEMPMKMTNQVSSNPESHHFYLSADQRGLLGLNESSGVSMGSNQFWMSDQHANSPKSIAGQKPSLAVKRKAEVEPLSNTSASPRFLHQNRLGSPVTPSQPNKKMMRSDSVSGKSGSQRGRQTAKMESASKINSGSSDAVRSKMRESLAAALTLNSEKNQSDTNTNHNPMASDVSDSGCGGVFPSNEFNGTGDVQGFQYSLPDEDVSFGDNFFGKDDLLQGNGLSWAFDFDMHMGERKDSQHVEKSASLTPEDLAFNVEAELFKLFGGVNKKYRERGRSLLFNLKDPNNPELRERVMSGEISPERLCSMSAEELASKELSEWRMAKAEELAQMKVLPDTEVDIRRLVRKTHKGEFQVEEVEHDDAMAADVSGGASVLTRPQRKKPVESPSPSTSGASVSVKDSSGSLIISTDGSDPMQGMMMVDELKEADLPPIVSLDEFMESLNNENPFENISGGAGKKSPSSNGQSPKLASKSRSSSRASEIRKDTMKRTTSSATKHGMTVGLSSSPAKETKISNSDHIWDGILQLNTSSSVSVGALFQSGERTSTKEWPASVDVKGRVRLDAFEKFVQGLPMSRTRAVMVIHLVLRDNCLDEQRSSLAEAIKSYIADERLGYAEPIPGAELYLCPPASRMFDILNKHLLKEGDKTFENGLIGIVVWRRAHISNTISPNSSSHKKHAIKKQALAPPKKTQHSPNINPNTPTRITKPHPAPDEDDDDDIPPGFGPGVPVKDDDDLPEFNFSGDLNPSVSRISPRDSLHALRKTSRPVDQVRELIKRYGQGESSGSVVDRSLGIEPWNDDDDDIPEWQPQAAPLLHQPYSHQHPPTNPGGAHPPPPGYARGARWRQY